MLGAVGFLVAGVWQAYDIHTLAARGVVVRADVVQERPGRHPVLEVEFTTTTGERVRAETSNYRDLQGAPTVSVVYDPRDPQRMQAADWGYDYWLPALCLAGSVAMVLYVVGTPAGRLRRVWRRMRG